MDSGKLVRPSDFCQGGTLKEPGTERLVMGGGGRERERELCISDEFALESPCFPSIEQDRHLGDRRLDRRAFRGFWSGHWKWQHPYFT